MNGKDNHNGKSNSVDGKNVLPEKKTNGEGRHIEVDDEKLDTEELQIKAMIDWAGCF